MYSYKIKIKLLHELNRKAKYTTVRAMAVTATGLYWMCRFTDVNYRRLWKMFINLTFILIMI